MKLRLHHMQILRRLAGRKEYDGPESGPEISAALGHASYWATPKLKAMKAAGLVDELGTTSTGAGCFTITDAGRKALEECR